MANISGIGNVTANGEVLPKWAHYRINTNKLPQGQKMLPQSGKMRSSNISEISNSKKLLRQGPSVFRGQINGHCIRVLHSPPPLENILPPPDKVKGGGGGGGVSGVTLPFGAPPADFFLPPYKIFTVSKKKKKKKGRHFFFGFGPVLSFEKKIQL